MTAILLYIYIPRGWGVASWSWSHGSCIYYLCNQCLSPL